MSRHSLHSRGPFTADQLRSGDPYELSNGHAIQVLPTGGRGSGANAIGAAVLRSDPDVESVGVDPGFSPEPGTLRAPDVAVGVSDEPGWTKGAPPLAIEYADRGQNEDDLKVKIRELLDAGTQIIWVVRLEGLRRVEVHQADEPMRLAHAGDELTAPGILRNPVPVAALYDWRTAEGVTLRNLLQKQGFQDLDDVLEKGRKEGRSEGREEGELHARRSVLLEMIDDRGLELDEAQRHRIEECRDLDQLKVWFKRSLTAESTADILG